MKTTELAALIRAGVLVSPPNGGTWRYAPETEGHELAGVPVCPSSSKDEDAPHIYVGGSSIFQIED